MVSFGTIDLTESTELIFFIDTYKGIEFANIRKFIKSIRYAGPTKKGIKLNKNVLKLVVDALKKISQDITTIEEQEIVKIPVYKGKFINVNINLYNGDYWIDIRVYYETELYKGPSKNGIRIPFCNLNETILYLDGMLNNIGKNSGEEELNHQIKPYKKDSDKNEENIEGVPDDYKQYF